MIERHALMVGGVMTALILGYRFLLYNPPPKAPDPCDVHPTSGEQFDCRMGRLEAEMAQRQREWDAQHPADRRYFQCIQNAERITASGRMQDVPKGVEALRQCNAQYQAEKPR